MSHFTVLVIGNEPEKQLQPYHEYECTGTDDEYVIEVDKTEEVKEWVEYEVFVGISKESGVLDYQYSEERAAETFVSFEKMPRKNYIELKGEDLETEIVDYHGYEKKEGKWILHTNPNSKWDWYKLGGRWTGFFKMKESVGLYTIGTPGLMTDEAEEGYADQAYKKDIDFDFKRDKAACKAASDYDFVISKIGHLPVQEPWEIVRAKHKDGDHARSEYWNQPRCQAWQSSKDIQDRMGWSESPDEFLVSKEEYVDMARNAAGVPFAVVKDSQWFEKGQMGWFAMVSNEMDQEEWNKQFWQMIDELPDDTLLSLYDCHI